MSIVGGLDIHRKQVTFDYPGTATGEVRRGQIAPADREHLAAWLAGRFTGQDAHFAMEGCTGWRYVAGELAAAGIIPHVGEPADGHADGLQRMSGRIPHASLPPGRRSSAPGQPRQGRLRRRLRGRSAPLDPARRSQDVAPIRGREQSEARPGPGTEPVISQETEPVATPGRCR